MNTLKVGCAFIAATALWALLAAYAALSGWWMSPVVTPGDHAAFHRWAVAEITAKNPGNTALVLLHDGAVTGEYYGRRENFVDADTLFPTASFSKWITAMTVMSLVEAGEIDLDRPVSAYLSRWHLPTTRFDNDSVTVRRLLSHTAGLTDQLGFGDYGADETIPPIEASLQSPRGSRGAGVEIAVGREPGTAFLYSGGGYLILQLIVEEVTGSDFPEHVKATLLAPMGMSRSTYEFLGDLDNASKSFHTDGSTAPSYRYASAAATGFGTSTSDLTKLVAALGARAKSPLAPATIQSMRRPHGYTFGFGIWGLGTILYAPTPAGDFVYGHDGVNEPAINTSVRINPDTGDGFILLVSGHPTLASNIGSEWVLWQTGTPDFLSAERALRSAITPILLGGLLFLGMGSMWLRRRGATEVSRASAGSASLPRRSRFRR